MNRSIETTEEATRLEWCCSCRFWQPTEDSERGKCQSVRSPMVMDITFYADSCKAWKSNNVVIEGNKDV